MEEVVVTVLAGDEAEPTVGLHPLHGAVGLLLSRHQPASM
jgi:hypothetical protein